MRCITISATTTETGDPIAVPCSCLKCLPLYWKNVDSKHSFSKSIILSFGSGNGMSSAVCCNKVPVQSNASWSGMLVNCDFTSKDTSLWLFGICTVLIASIKFSFDCSLWSDASVSGFKVLAKCLDSWYVGVPQNETMSLIVSGSQRYIN